LNLKTIKKVTRSFETIVAKEWLSKRRVTDVKRELRETKVFYCVLISWVLSLD